jgi:hypothetical protein
MQETFKTKKVSKVLIILRIVFTFKVIKDNVLGRGVGFVGCYYSVETLQCNVYRINLRV